MPQPAPAGYSGTPLPAKLGIKPGAIVALIGAPPGFEAALAPLPAGTRTTRAGRARADLTLWFVTSRRTLAAKMKGMAPRAERSGLWIVWPKLAAKTGSDLTEGIVRQTAIAAGLVDFKVCAVDEKWSGLRFNRRQDGGTVPDGPGSPDGDRHAWPRRRTRGSGPASTTLRRHRTAVRQSAAWPTA